MSSIDFSTLTQKIAALLAAHPEQPVLIALDGRCGSGKTTLAGQLAEQFPASIVFHTDDYYLPPDQRIPDWEKTPCANMDLARLREELLRPARAGRADDDAELALVYVKIQVVGCRDANRASLIVFGNIFKLNEVLHSCSPCLGCQFYSNLTIP